MNDPIWTCMLLAVLCGGMAGAAGFSAMREDEIKGIVLLLANS